ncbi:uncharacterized protein METZ01_LOCUS419078, partial [marine metagenome]
VRTRLDRQDIIKSRSATDDEQPEGVADS